MPEVPSFLVNGRHRLYSVLHTPDQIPNGRAFVFCHPLAEEKLWTHRVFVAFARRLAAEGYTVLRLDIRGNGDSDGDFSEMSVEAAVSDIRCGVDDVRRRAGVETVDLLGLRFGATIASLVADRSADIDRLVSWAPIVDGEKYMLELLRVNVATQTAVYKEVRNERQELIEAMRRGQTVNVDGYSLAYPLYSEAAAINLAAETKQHRGPCLVVQIDRRPDRPSADLQQLAARYRRGALVCAQEEPFWKEIATSYLRHAPNLFQATLEWLGNEPRNDEGVSLPQVSP